VRRQRFGEAAHQRLALAGMAEKDLHAALVLSPVSIDVTPRKPFCQARSVHIDRSLFNRRALTENDTPFDSVVANQARGNVSTKDTPSSSLRATIVPPIFDM
jgi:hypothetical protein